MKNNKNQLRTMKNQSETVKTMITWLWVVTGDRKPKGGNDNFRYKQRHFIIIYIIDQDVYHRVNFIECKCSAQFMRQLTHIYYVI